MNEHRVSKPEQLGSRQQAPAVSMSGEDAQDLLCPTQSEAGDQIAPTVGYNSLDLGEEVVALDRPIGVCRLVAVRRLQHQEVDWSGIARPAVLGHRELPEVGEVARQEHPPAASLDQYTRRAKNVSGREQREAEIAAERDWLFRPHGAESPVDLLHVLTVVGLLVHLAPRHVSALCLVLSEEPLVVLARVLQHDGDQLGGLRGGKDLVVIVVPQTPDKRWTPATMIRVRVRQDHRINTATETVKDRKSVV